MPLIFGLLLVLLVLLTALSYFSRKVEVSFFFRNSIIAIRSALRLMFGQCLILFVFAKSARNFLREFSETSPRFVIVERVSFACRSTWTAATPAAFEIPGTG